MFFRLILLFFLGFGCSSPQKEELPAQVALSFLSLSPAITETIYYLGGETQLIGRSDYCFYPTQAKEKPSYGTSFTPKWEKIAQAKATDILVDQSIGGHTEALEKMATLHQLPWLTLDDVQSSIVSIGDLIGAGVKARELAAQFQREFQSRVTNDSPTVLLLMLGSEIQKGQIWFIREDSLHGAAISAAGLRNVAPAVQNTPNMSVEQLIAINPQMILLIGPDEMPKDSETTMTNTLMQIKELQAVQQAKIGRVHLENAMGIGPNILALPKAIQQTVQTFVK